MRRLCQYKGVEVIEGNACIDHIHVCLSIPPKYSVSTIVGYLKGKSTMIVFERYSRLRRNFKGNSFWARGYYVNTVGLDEAKIRKYIKNQQMNESVMDDADSQIPSCEDDLCCDPDYPTEVYASYLLAFSFEPFIFFLYLN